MVIGGMLMLLLPGPKLMLGRPIKPPPPTFGVIALARIPIASPWSGEGSISLNPSSLLSSIGLNPEPK
jgi:hypothetical protein